MLEEGQAISKIAKEVNITRQTVYRIKNDKGYTVPLLMDCHLQMSVSHSVPKYMLIMYYEILIIRQEKERANTLSLFLYFFSITTIVIGI